MIVEIASRVRETLLAEAVAAAGDECCGLLLGSPGRITALVPARNVAADPARSFEIEPATLLRTHREARGRGQQVIGHYHSHPNGRPEPSLRDAARAVGNGGIWLIIAGGTLGAWSVVGNDSGASAVHDSGASAVHDFGAGAVHDFGASAVHGRFLPVTLHTLTATA